MNRTKILLTLLASLSGSTYAADSIYLGNPSYGGTGCPNGTASASLSPDAKSLSILFDQYVAEAGGMTGKSLDRKTCNISVPVHVPQGYSVSVLAIDYRGFNSLPAGASSVFGVEYFFAGAVGPRVSRTFRGPASSDYLIRNNLIAESLVWSQCGADVNLRINSSIRVQTNYNYEDAMTTVDSADISAGIIFLLQWRKC